MSHQFQGATLDATARILGSLLGAFWDRNHVFYATCESANDCNDGGDPDHESNSQNRIVRHRPSLRRRVAGGGALGEATQQRHLLNARAEPCESQRMATERQMEALTLRVRGRLLYREIGERLGVTETEAALLVDRAMVSLNRPISTVIRDQRKDSVRRKLQRAEKILYDGVTARDPKVAREWRGTLDQLAKLDGLNEPVKTEVKLDMASWEKLPPDEVRSKVREFVREHLDVLGAIVDELRSE